MFSNKPQHQIHESNRCVYWKAQCENHEHSFRANKFLEIFGASQHWLKSCGITLEYLNYLETLNLKENLCFLKQLKKALGVYPCVYMCAHTCLCGRLCTWTCWGVATLVLWAHVPIYGCWLVSMCFLEIEQRLVQAQNLTQGWEEIKHLKAELWIYLQDADQQLQNMKRRHSELELNIAQNMVSQVKVGIDLSPGEIKEAKMVERWNVLNIFTSVCLRVCQSLNIITAT